MKILSFLFLLPVSICFGNVLSNDDAAFLEKQYTCRSLRFIAHLQTNYKLFRFDVNRRQLVEKNLKCADYSAAIKAFSAKATSPMVQFILQQIKDPTFDGAEQRTIRNIENFKKQFQPVPKGVDANHVARRIASCNIEEWMSHESGMGMFQPVASYCEELRKTISLKKHPPNEKKIYETAAKFIVPTALWIDAYSKAAKSSLQVDISKTEIEDLAKNFPALLKEIKTVAHVDGIKIAKVTQNSIWYRLGLRDGDQIHFVAGKYTTHLSDLIPLYFSLVETRQSSIKAFISRNRALVAVQVNVMPAPVKKVDSPTSGQKSPAPAEKSKTQK